ncbi:MAG TPA: hypothetical protein VHK90_10775 [Thermoanaerobaculia bacterium]|nr:hypothetical protein [Thermoanaerobaculia bacterium]
MSNSTNKSIADGEQTRSHHRLDEERHGQRTGDARSHQPDERGRHIEREVAKRAKKK